MMGCMLSVLLLALAACPPCGPWEKAGDFRYRRVPQAVALRDGRALVLGGATDWTHTSQGRSVPLVDVFEPRTRTFKPGPPMRVGRQDFSVTSSRTGASWSWAAGTENGTRFAPRRCSIPGAAPGS
jgi:hypothetical protein